MKKNLLSIVTIVAFLTCPNVNFAQTINLGASGSFVVFTTAGAITNSGTTYLTKLTGNVGSNSGQSTGFGNVNGSMLDGGPISAQASTDLIAANVQLSNKIPTFFPGVLLGNGVTLVPGVNGIAAPTTLSGELILDAQGDANAEFIFKISGTLDLTADAKVRLINGAQACNVFWKVDGGAVNMAVRAFMKGTIVANGGAINMNVNDTLEGRALSIAGAITTNTVLGYTPPGCAKVQLTGPTAPNLGASGCYAILSGNGSVTNSGISTITGDVGTNVGLTVGFDGATTVNGTVHPIADASTAAASSDLLAGYNYLNALTEDILLLYPAEFGHNLVLTPHTYLMNGATTFTDSVYLNAEGNANAVFVLKLKGALNAGVNSKVLLINGAQAKNVYWLVDGAVTIQGTSVFNGTIVANGAITLATGVNITGRALTNGGALSNTSSITVISPSGDCRVLPVTWLYFRGKPLQQNVLLEWATTNEMSNSFFTVEKSRDGQSFETLTTVNATKTTGAAEQDYSFTDQQAASLNYYRISQTDKDGQKNSYKTIQVKLNTTPGFNERHYVLGNNIYVQASGAVPGNGTMDLYSTDGKKLSSQKIVLTKEVSTYKINRQLGKGIYLLKIQNQQGKLYNGKVMVL